MSFSFCEGPCYVAEETKAALYDSASPGNQVSPGPSEACWECECFSSSSYPTTSLYLPPPVFTIYPLFSLHPFSLAPSLLSLPPPSPLSNFLFYWYYSLFILLPLCLLLLHSLFLYFHRIILFSAEQRWSRQASSLLFQMTKDKPIVAIVSSVVVSTSSSCCTHTRTNTPLSPQGGLISATLCDTTTEEDIHINDTLVSQGLAIFVKDTEEEEKKYDGYKPEQLPIGVSTLPKKNGRFYNFKCQKSAH